MPTDFTPYHPSLGNASEPFRFHMSPTLTIRRARCRAGTLLLTRHQAGDPKPKTYAPTGSTTATTDGATAGVGLYAIILLGGILAFGAYKYLQTQQES